VIHEEDGPCVIHPSQSASIARICATMKPYNKTCKGCRISKVTKCDMLTADGEVQTCSRCARLKMHCIPEQRKYAAQTNLRPELRALLKGDGSDASSSTTVTVALPPISNEPPLPNADLEVCNSFSSLLGAGATVDQPVLEQVLKMVAEVARNSDSCGLMSYAMAKAHELGVTLSRVLPSSETNVSTHAPNFKPPAAAMELYDQPLTACYMRIFSGGRTWSLANAAFKREITADDASFATFSPTKMLTVLERAADRRLLLSCISETLQGQLQPIPATAGVYMTESHADRPVDVRVRAGANAGRLVPYQLRVRYVRTNGAESANFLCVAVTPTSDAPTATLVQACPLLGAADASHASAPHAPQAPQTQPSSQARRDESQVQPPAAKRARAGPTLASVGPPLSTLAAGMSASALPSMGSPGLFFPVLSGISSTSSATSIASTVSMTSIASSSTSSTSSGTPFASGMFTTPPELMRFMNTNDAQQHAAAFPVAQPLHSASDILASPPPFEPYPLPMSIPTGRPVVMATHSMPAVHAPNDTRAAPNATHTAAHAGFGTSEAADQSTSAMSAALGADAFTSMPSMGLAEALALLLD